MDLQAGWHPIMVKYYNGYTYSELQLRYRTNGSEFQVIPEQALAHQITVRPPMKELADPIYRSQEAVEMPQNLERGLRGGKYNVGLVGSTPDFSALTPDETALFYEIRWAQVEDIYEDERLLKSATAFQFEGFIYIDTTDNWSFELTSDDGATLIIDDVLTVNNDGVHGSETSEGSAQLAQGWHPITINYFNYDKGAGLRLRFRNSDGEY